VALDQENSSLNWWKKYESMLPVVGFVTRNYLAIPGSQIEVERIFSVSGLLTGLRRCNLGVENLESLILLIKNWPKDPTTDAEPMNSYFESSVSAFIASESVLCAEKKSWPTNLSNKYITIDRFICYSLFASYMLVVTIFACWTTALVIQNIILKAFLIKNFLKS